MGKPKSNRFKDKDTENFYLGERVLKFQELSKSDKQSAHRKIVLIYQAKNWSEIILYFPYGVSGGRLEKIGDKGQHIKLSIMVRDKDLHPIHPGEILREELLKTYKLSAEQLAQSIQVENKIVEEILAEKQDITPELSYRLGCY
ncbi:3976_t:CDS:2 [Funneliformis geosporum]|uniref:3976_t:CDS:1 n=1 Tax=Funneliformis geosporum TaxID=1117311 RepID=A0A9W4X0I3_9GLOM|nr:3976_t:CDS:2 [Funneliformis geosporum]